MPNDAFQRRMAIQVVASLPDDPEEAQAVLRYAQILLSQFVAAKWYERADDSQDFAVLPFRAPPPSSA
jgi:hypothetical protein